jgi:hypothetical protein
MSGHADTIRVAEGVLAGEPGARYMGVDRDLAERALALAAENQQLRDALDFYADRVNYENATPRMVRPVIADRGAVARAALDATPSEDT